LDRGVDVRLNASVRELVTEKGRVVGLTVRIDGKDQHIRARKGVLLATGGGNGWRLAAGAGADIRSSPNLPALPAFSVPEEDGLSRANYEPRMRHSLIVNRFGERFGDEVPYQGLMVGWLKFDAHGEHRWVNIPNYLIFDRQALEKYSFAGRPPGATEGLDWLAQGHTIAELARNMNIPPEKLTATLERFNENAGKGEDPDFHRIPETLGKLEKPPFYGVQCDPPDFDPMAASMSAVVDCNGQMLDHETHQPIPGLYGAYSGATKSEIRKMVFGYGYTAGLGQATSITFDLLSAEHAAASEAS
jgi:3-oxosteroid 1-dehydrogenase